MLYRPAFCCNCGEKIQRDEWRLWTSRRFCPLCETEHKGIDILPRVVIGLGLIMTVFGFASYIRKPNKTTTGEEIVRPTQLRSDLKPAPKQNDGSSNAKIQPNPAAPATGNVALSQLNEQPKQEKTTSDETVYYCGAITKKGTPCTRRVKTKGFCWQHARAGQVAPARF